MVDRQWLKRLRSAAAETRVALRIPSIACTGMKAHQSGQIRAQSFLPASQPVWESLELQGDLPLSLSLSLSLSLLLSLSLSLSLLLSLSLSLPPSLTLSPSLSLSLTLTLYLSLLLSHSLSTSNSAYCIFLHAYLRLWFYFPPPSFSCLILYNFCSFALRSLSLSLSLCLPLLFCSLALPVPSCIGEWDGVSSPRGQLCLLNHSAHTFTGIHVTSYYSGESWTRQN